jgi:uncharacterized DUF497 family protein
MKYEWDASKEKLNISKHGISFSEAREALTCGLVIVLREDDSKTESTYVYLGMCKKLKVIVVVVTYPEEEITRIISARKANKKERKFYEEKL